MLHLKSGQLRVLGAFLKANIAFLADEKLVCIEIYEYLKTINLEFLVGFWILAATGCRWSELKKLNYKSVDESGALYIKGSKGSNDRLNKCFPSSTQDFLKSIKFESDFLFGFYSVYHFASIDLKYKIQTTGIAKINKSLHIFRHCKVNTLLLQGFTIEEIQKHLGHQDSGSTHNYLKTVKITVI